MIIQMMHNLKEINIKFISKGDYTNTSCMYLGFYTTLSGLGKVPTDVKLNNIAIQLIFQQEL